MTTKIKFGLALDFWSAVQPFAERLDEYVALLELAESYGFTSVWAGENRPRGPEPGHTPSPLLVLAGLARQTKLQLGTGVALITIQHPLQLAYDAVMLDHLTEGRFVLGASVGSPQVMKRYGLPPAEAAARMDETLALLKALWAGAEKFEGALFKVAGRIYPQPYTPGGPPILVGGKLQRSVARAVEYGAGWYGATQYHFALIKQQAQRYRELLAVQGRDADTGIIAINRTTFVAETDERARQEGRAYVSQVLDFYGSIGALTDAHGNSLPRETNFFETLGDETYFCGSPATCLASLRKYVEAGVNQFNLRVSMGEMPVELARRTVTLLGEEVLPHFRA